MKLCKIYSNKDFKNISFNDEFNVIFARIHDKSKHDTDTHNLGKTLLISVIDFLLLKKISDKSRFFLTKGGFQDQIFFAEILLNNGKYLIIRRSTNNPSKVSFKLNDVMLEKDNYEENFSWDHEKISFDKAKQLLNAYLAFNIVPDWQYRKSINYFLRTQNDYRDVFKLDKFKGRDKDWKPFMFSLLGFNGEIIQNKYDLEEKHENLKKKLDTLQKDAKINIDERDKIVGLLDIKKSDKEKIELSIDHFNFFEKDKELNKELIDKYDSVINIMNTHRYNITFEINKIQRSLNSKQPELNINKLKSLFNDVKIYFPDNLTQEYDQLLHFNRSITKERNLILKENYKRLQNELKNLNQEISKQESKKEKLLSFLTEKDSYSKFKEYQKQLSKFEAEIEILKEKLEVVDNTSYITKEMDELTLKIQEKIKETESAIEEQRHANIRKLFNQIIENVLATNALISIKKPNKNGNIEFEANIQNPKDFSTTEEDYGTSYRKLMCMAFDLALMINYSNRSFYRFVYHDGALEALDNRKKIKFISIIEKICRDNNLQYILTLIDSDLPSDEQDRIIPFDRNDICLELHDKDDTGKLFEKSF